MSSLASLVMALSSDVRPGAINGPISSNSTMSDPHSSLWKPEHCLETVAAPHRNAMQNARAKLYNCLLNMLINPAVVTARTDRQPDLHRKPLAMPTGL